MKKLIIVSLLVIAGGAYLWAAKNAKPKRPKKLLTLRDGARWGQFNSDGTQIITTGGDGGIIWNARTGQKLYVLPHESSEIGRFSSKGDKVLTISMDKGIIWDAKTGKKLHILAETDKSKSFMDGTFSPDGKKVVLDGSPISIWDAQTGEYLFALPNNLEFSYFGAFSSDSNQFITNDQYKKLIIWNLNTGKKIKELIQDKRSSPGIFIHDNSKIISGSYGVILIWDVKTGKVVKEIPTGKNSLVEIGGVSSDDKKVYVSSSGGWPSTEEYLMASIWDINAGKETRRVIIKGKNGMASFSKDGKKVLFYDLIPGELWSMNTGKKMYTLPNSEEPSFSPDGKKVITNTRDGAVVWDISK